MQIIINYMRIMFMHIPLLPEVVQRSGVKRWVQAVVMSTVTEHTVIATLTATNILSSTSEGE